MRRVMPWRLPSWSCKTEIICDSKSASQIFRAMSFQKYGKGGLFLKILRDPTSQGIPGTCWKGLAFLCDAAETRSFSSLHLFDHLYFSFLPRVASKTKSKYGALSQQNKSQRAFVISPCHGHGFVFVHLDITISINVFDSLKGIFLFFSKSIFRTTAHQSKISGLLYLLTTDPPRGDYFR